MTGIVSSPYTGRVNRVDGVMLQVILALIPGALAMIWFFGWGLLIQMALATATAVAAEAMVMRLRGRPAVPALSDLSAVVTALLLAIAIPPTLPWWLTVLGVLFAILVVKQLYGGLGYNPFNPAMAAYVFLLISYPVDMTRWLPPHMLADQTLGFMDALRAIFFGTVPGGAWDAITAATPLGEMRTQLGLNKMIAEIRQSPLWGDFGGRGWEWVANWFLVGGLYLLWKRIITWHIPVAFLGGLLLIAGFFADCYQTRRLPLPENDLPKNWATASARSDSPFFYFDILMLLIYVYMHENNRSNKRRPSETGQKTGDP